MTGGAPSRWPLWPAVIGAAAGIAMLTAWFQPFWPGTKWTVLPRAQLVAKAHAIAQHFGSDASDWKLSSAASFARPLAFYEQTHPDDWEARSISPLSLTAKLAAKKGENECKVALDSAGLPMSWRAPDEFKPKQNFASDDDAASQAFRYFAGSHQGEFGTADRSSGDELHEEEYVWKKRSAPRSDLRERIKVVVQDRAVRSVERTTNLSSTSDEDDSSDTGDNQGYWDILDVIFGLVCTSVFIIVAGIYVLWLVRRAVNHRFAVRLAGLAFCLMLAGRVVNSFDMGEVVGAFFKALGVLAIVIVGRGISNSARPKWMSLEQLCMLAPFAKLTGNSLAAGLLFSPLLLAVPFLIAACGLFPHTVVLARNVDVIYSPAPLLNSISLPNAAFPLGFFGFGIPALQRLVRLRWLSWLIAFPLGVLFFAVQTPVVAGPLVAPLSAGLCSLGIFWFVYARFDLLAVLALQFASVMVLSLSMLLVKGGGAWSLWLAIGCLFVVSWWLRARGQAVAEGDPLATIPAIADFRAEREKLKAEFSVARRAQQDMLPEIPPSIPGYSIAASCTPSLEVGGDLYDFLTLPDGRIGIGVADVSGKGVPAALYMTLTKGLLGSVSRNNSQLKGVVEEVNHHLHGVTRKKVFVTMALGFLDAERHLLECVRAGHNPMVWRQKNRDLTSLVAPGGLGLGITASRVFSHQLKVETMALEDGDAVVFYSDGITEAMNRELEQFGERRLMDAVAKADNLDAAAARDVILTDVRVFLDGVHPQDDMTLVVLRVGANH